MDKKLIILVLFLVFLIGIIYLNNKSLTGSTGNVIADFSSEQIIIPVKAHIIVDSSGAYTSSRNKENIIELFNEVNRIWSQGDLYFSVEEISVTNVSFTTIQNAINSNYAELYNHKNFDREQINVFFAQSLNGINGLALYPIKTALISDYTTVNDFRATSHELGHLLGLKHVAPENRLMARGKNGEILSKQEIEVARKNAKFI